MITVLKKGATLEVISEINKEVSNRPSKKGLDAHKFCGSVKFKEDNKVND